MLKRCVRTNFYWPLLTITMVLLAIGAYPRHPPGFLPLPQLFPIGSERWDTLVHVNFDGVRLDQVLATLAKEAGCTITVSWAAVDFTGLHPDVLVTAHAPAPVPLERAIDLVLGWDPLARWPQWDFHSVIQLGPEPDLFHAPAVVAYDVCNLMQTPDSGARDWMYEMLVTKISDTWVPNMGSDDVVPDVANTRNAFIGHYNGKLIVRASPYDQRRVVEFLTKLRVP